MLRTEEKTSSDPSESGPLARWSDVGAHTPQPSGWTELLELYDRSVGDVYGYLYTAHQQIQDKSGEPCINARSVFVPTNRFAAAKNGHDVSIYFDEKGDGQPAEKYTAHRRTGTYTYTYWCEPLGVPLRSRATASVSGPNPWSSWTDVDSDD